MSSIKSGATKVAKKVIPKTTLGKVAAIGAAAVGINTAKNKDSEKDKKKQNSSEK